MTAPFDVHPADTAAALLDELGIDLSKLTPDDLYARLRAELIDRDIMSNNDLDDAWETL